MWTVLDAFQKAEFPTRVFVAICQQNHPTADTHLDALLPTELDLYKKQIRILRLSHDEAKGPTYARALIEQQLYQQEDFVLMIDSHTLFVPRWDTLCLEQLLMCPSPKPILTTYPQVYDQKTRDIPLHDERPPYLTFRSFHPRLGFVQTNPQVMAHKPPSPLPSLFFAACFAFGPACWWHEVPYDPHLSYVFLGEEISMAARLYTAGYDLFAPACHLVYHLVSRHYRPTFWENFYHRYGQVSAEVEQQRKLLERDGNRRLRALMTREPPEKLQPYKPPAPYGLGTARTLADYETYAGVDLTLKGYHKRAKLGLTAIPTAEELYYKLGL